MQRKDFPVIYDQKKNITAHHIRLLINVRGIKMKIAAVVILYNPAHDVAKNIQSYFGAIDKLYIVDNSLKAASQVRETFINQKNVVYLHDGENKGIAARLNQVIKLAKEDGYDWLLTMDQDSFFEKGEFNNYLHCCENFDRKETVSMFGIFFSESAGHSTDCDFINVKHLITSGTLMNLKLNEYIGEFDENFFIDEVDFEYCLRSVSVGFKIIQFSNIFLNHSLGEVSYHRSFKNNKTTQRVLHSPERLYYITRNFLYVQSKYKTIFPGEIKERRKILFNRVKNNLLYNKERTRVLKYIAKGILDFRQSKMGKLNNS